MNDRRVMLAFGWLAVLVTVIAGVAAGVIAALIAGGAVAVLVVGGIAFTYARERSDPRRPQGALERADNLDPNDPIHRAPMPARKYAGLLWTAFLIHLLAVAVLNLTGLNHALAPDSRAFRYCGVFIAESWADPSYDAAWHDEDRPHSEICPTYKARSFYQHLNGVMEYLIGIESYTHLLLGFVNTLLGFLAALIFAKCAQGLYGRYAGQMTMLLIVFFPSLIVWTSINLREAWSFLLLAISMSSAMRLRERFNARDVLFFLAAIGMLVTVRGYLVAVIAMATMMSYFAVRIRQIPAAIVMLTLCFVIISQLAARFGFSASELDISAQLEIANNMHRGLAYGGSAFGADADISTPTGALLYLPKGMAMFMLSPFPWSIDSWRQMLAVGETLVWYVLLLFALRQMWYSARRELVRVALPISLAFVICVAYALVEGNAGTAYRHRAHAVLIFLVFAAGDLARRKGEKSVRSRASLYPAGMEEAIAPRGP